MSFDDLLADANDAFFEAFAERERIIYMPADGRDRAIMAIIDRPPPELVEPGKKGAEFILIISVDNDPISGITPDRFSAQTDRVQVPLQLGGELVERGFVNERFEQDGGMLKIKVK